MIGFCVLPKILSFVLFLNREKNESADKHKAAAPVLGHLFTFWFVAKPEWQKALHKCLHRLYCAVSYRERGKQMHVLRTEPSRGGNKDICLNCTATNAITGIFIDVYWSAQKDMYHSCCFFLSRRIIKKLLFWECKMHGRKCEKIQLKTSSLRSTC